MHAAPSVSPPRPAAAGRLRGWPFAVGLAGLTAAAAAAWIFLGGGWLGGGWPARQPLPPANEQTRATGDAATDDEQHPDVVRFPEDRWPSASIMIEPATTARMEQITTLTGKVTLNEDRLAHVFPLVEGRVEEVNISLGDQVTKGQQMAVIQSREVGDAMLTLAQDRLQLGFATQRDAWTQSIAANTLELVRLLRSQAPIEQIETELRDRPLGEYRDKLMTAYINQATSRKNVERLEPLRSQGILASRQIYEAEAAWTSDRATLQSLLEQLEQDARQAAIRSTQSVKELETRVAVDEAALEILGLDKAAYAVIDPTAGASLARCPILAPFDGTVISKDVALLEHVGPTNQILGVADLSTVWLTADVFEEQLPLMQGLEEGTIRFRSQAWPGESFEARVFYTGDLVDRESRTLGMRAVADNPDRKLKPGLFVTIELPDVEAATVLQVPASAVLEHEGASFVFVHLGDDRFQRRDIEPGRRSADAIEVHSGIAAGDRVVTGGGFALKSRMLSALLEE